MVIDIHGHVVAPPELYAYRAGLMAGRGAHGKGRVNIDDEKLKNAVWSGGGGALKHADVL